MKGPVCFLLFAAAASAPAEERKPELPAVSYAPFPLPLVRTYVFAANELPRNEAFTDPVFPHDFPPSLVLFFQDARKYKTPKGSYAFQSKNVLRVYRLSAMAKDRGHSVQKPLAELQKLLQSRPAEVLVDEHHYSLLPDFPERNSAHAFQLKLAYVDADWGSGLCYMTVFTQDGSNHASNDELQYLFQGVSRDGAYYVSADFHLTHPRLDTWRPPEGSKGEYAADRKLLSGLKEESFTPTLPVIRRWLGTLKFE